MARRRTAWPKASAIRAPKPATRSPPATSSARTRPHGRTPRDPAPRRPGYSIYRIAQLAKDLYSIYVYVSILVWIIGQAIPNIAVVTGMVPVSGVPLPFLFYGGSSVIALLAAVGVLSSCSRGIDRQASIASSQSASP